MNYICAFSDDIGSTEQAREKAMQNLHYIERYQERTIPHAIVMTYKKTKVIDSPPLVNNIFFFNSYA